MSLGKFVWGAIVGAVACGMFLKTQKYVSSCVVGTPEQEAADVAVYMPAMLEALVRVRRSDLANKRDTASDERLDEIAQAVTYAWSHLQQCVAQRGMDYCQAIGTEAELPLRAPDKGGPAESDAELYRYGIPPETPGPNFSMKFWPKGFSEWTEIEMAFPELGFRVNVALAMYRCVDGISNSSVRGAAIYEFEGA